MYPSAPFESGIVLVSTSQDAFIPRSSHLMQPPRHQSFLSGLFSGKLIADCNHRWEVTTPHRYPCPSAGRRRSTPNPTRTKGKYHPRYAKANLPIYQFIEQKHNLYSVLRTDLGNNYSSISSHVSPWTGCRGPKETGGCINKMTSGICIELHTPDFDIRCINYPVGPGRAGGPLAHCGLWIY